MEENIVTNPSSENVVLPQNAPAGVFVPNGQMSVESVIPVQEQVSQPVETPVVLQTEQTPPVETKKEGALDRFFTGVAKFIAKISGQPDPITGVQNSASQTLQKSQNIVGKVRGVANQVVEKAGDAATKATDTVGKVTEKIQQVIPPPPAAPTDQTPQVVQPTPDQVK